MMYRVMTIVEISIIKYDDSREIHERFSAKTDTGSDEFFLRLPHSSL